MDDAKIVDLYWQRSEQAIPETASKYGHYCYSVAHRIVNNREDSEECVNDTWLGAWNAIPPHRPDPLSVFLGKITRRLALGIMPRLPAMAALSSLRMSPKRLPVMITSNWEGRRISCMAALSTYI